MKYLLDTNLICEPLRPAPNPGVLENLRIHETELAISAITWHELWFGCMRLPESARRAAIEQYLLHVLAVSLPVLPYDEAAADWHAAERARLSALGKTPSFAGGQIAAIARQNDLVLVTSNLADFQGFAGLNMEDWRV